MAMTTVGGVDLHDAIEGRINGLNFEGAAWAPFVEMSVAKEKGKLRRYVIDLAGGRGHEEIADDSAN